MERKRYLELCQKCAVLDEGVLGIKKNVPEELQVEYDGIVWYPEKYVLSFEKKTGNVVHTAVLHSLSANSTVEAELEKVKEVKKDEN